MAKPEKSQCLFAKLGTRISNCAQRERLCFGRGAAKLLKLPAGARWPTVPVSSSMLAFLGFRLESYFEGELKHLLVRQSTGRTS